MTLVVTSTIPVADIRCRVFDKRETTAEEEALLYSYAELRELLFSVRRDLKSTVAHLPDRAFEKQANDANGDEVWSAGQIVSHLIEASLRFGFYDRLRELSGSPGRTLPSEFESIRGEKVLSREQTLFALDLADLELELLIAEIPDAADFSATVSAPPFGDLSIRGWFLLTSLHEGVHVEQLQKLEC